MEPGYIQARPWHILKVGFSCGETRQARLCLNARCFYKQQLRRVCSVSHTRTYKSIPKILSRPHLPFRRLGPYDF